MGYSLCVRGSIMIAHSFTGIEFGLAQNMHGATYTVDCEFRAARLVAGSNWVIDIGEASRILETVLATYNYKNLDELPQFKGQNTTTEFMCHRLFEDMLPHLRQISFEGELCVKLAESHCAWASYTGEVRQ